MGLCRPGPRSPKVLRHQMVQWCARGHGDVLEMVTPAMKTTAVLLFFQLDKYTMFSFAMTSGLARDTDKFKIIITLRRVIKFGDTGSDKNFNLKKNISA